MRKILFLIFILLSISTYSITPSGIITITNSAINTSQSSISLDDFEKLQKNFKKLEDNLNSNDKLKNKLTEDFKDLKKEIKEDTKDKIDFYKSLIENYRKDTLEKVNNEIDILLDYVVYTLIDKDEKAKENLEKLNKEFVNQYCDSDFYNSISDKEKFDKIKSELESLKGEENQ